MRVRDCDREVVETWCRREGLRVVVIIGEDGYDSAWVGIGVGEGAQVGEDVAEGSFYESVLGRTINSYPLLPRSLRRK